MNIVPYAWKGDENVQNKQTKIPFIFWSAVFTLFSHPGQSMCTLISVIWKKLRERNINLEQNIRWRMKESGVAYSHFA